MKANVTHKEGGKPTSFIVTGDRTKWYWGVNDGVATFRRVEVKKDDHSTDTHVVLFGEEWVKMMDFVETLPFVVETKIQNPLTEK